MALMNVSEVTNVWLSVKKKKSYVNWSEKFYKYDFILYRNILNILRLKSF